ncbi:MAG: hypothetical protein A2137_06170 [Chloroflexi bacterium RBG_16_58_8]|nr:MAG: hypothetical protein A2137_06170 [Chloroflexi bacterium RBG_16_58_8]
MKLPTKGGKETKIIEIKYGDQHEVADLAGLTAGEAREQYRAEFGIPDKATAKLNGSKVKGGAEFDTVLNDDDKLTFATSRGMGAYLVGAVLLALAITGGVFAFGFVNASTSLNVSTINSNFADVSVNPDYANVDWNAFGFFKGSISGPYSLFDITPNPDYNGDLQVRVYLTNTAELLKAYRYLTMELYMAKSIEAGKRVNYQVLSLENGVAVFNIEGGSAARYQVELWGGAYRLVSENPEEWGAGWNIVPELYLEVTQR